MSSVNPGGSPMWMRVRWENRDLSVADAGAEITRPVYLPGYVAWEHRVGHHDQLTDVFSLGLILASCTCGLDLTDPEDRGTVRLNRGNLSRLAANFIPSLRV